MTQAVSIGDDGRPPGSDDGPLLATLKMWFTEIRDEGRRALEAHRLELLQALYQATPNGVPVRASGVVPSGGSLTLDLGGPQLGRRWLVRLLRATAATSVGDTLTGRADFYVGQPPGPGARPNVDTWVWGFATCPGVQPFTSETIPVTPSDHLYCVVSGSTSGQLALAGATILDYDATAAAGPAAQVI